MSRKAWFVALLIFWLASWPLSFILGFIASRISAQTAYMASDLVNSFNMMPADSSPPIVKVLNIASILLGMYMLVGWIPVLVMYSKMPKTGKAR